MIPAPETNWKVTPEAAVAAVRHSVLGYGKLETVPKVHVGSLRDIATLYTPGVGTLVQRIVADPREVDVLSNRANTIAVVTDGTAVLGFGRTGPLAALPVMEGKAIMFKLRSALMSRIRTGSSIISQRSSLHSPASTSRISQLLIVSPLSRS